MMSRCSGRRTPRKPFAPYRPGFNGAAPRRRSRRRARKLGMTTITLEYAGAHDQGSGVRRLHADLRQQRDRDAPETAALLATNEDGGSSGSNGNGADASPEDQAPASPYTWTAGCPERLDRAPAGFMRDCTRALIEKHADKIGTTVITLEVANEGIEQAKGYMEEAMKTGNLKDMIANLTGYKRRHRPGRATKWNT